MSADDRSKPSSAPAAPGASIDADIGTEETLDGEIGVGSVETSGSSVPDLLHDPSASAESSFTGEMPTVVPLIAGRYEVVALLGVGSSGRVYRVFDHELDEAVALKVLRRELLDAPEAVARFRREVKVARRVTHPNVARTYDIGEHVGQRFLTMELIDGEPLRQVIRARAPMAVGEAIALARQLCAGLVAAHAAGVVHRDLKPDNILVDKAGRAVITDFGIAHAFAQAAAHAGETARRLAVGTPAYMAPEQVQGRFEPDPRADLYALGAIVFELTTGRRAWPGSSAVAVATARLSEPPPDPRAVRADLPPALAELILACLARLPSDRPRGAAEVDATLAEIADRLVETPAPPRPVRQPTGRLPFVEPRAKTVAVLPFDVGADAGIEYLAAGLAEDIIDTLSMTDGLRVRPFAVVEEYAGSGRLTREIGEELGVASVVSGKLRRVGDQIRIRTRVISVEDGFQLWAGRFRCGVAELFEVGDQVAVAVAAALTVDARPEGVAVRAPEDGEAVDLYLRARYAMNRHWHEDVRGAMTLYDEALRRAPDDARILAGAAVTRARMAFLGTGDADAAVLDSAVDLAARAIAAAPARSEPYFAMGMVRFNQGEPRAAIEMLERAIDRAPSDADAHELLGRILSETGPIERAVEHLHTSLVHNRDAYNTRWDLVRAHAYIGDWESADNLLGLPVADEQRAWVRAITRARIDLWRETPRWVDAELPADGGSLMEPLTRMFRAVARSGLVDDACYQRLENYAAAAAAAPRRALLMLQFAAELAGYARDRARCLGYLHRAVDGGLTDAVWLTACPRLRWLEGSARHAILTDRVMARIR